MNIVPLGQGGTRTPSLWKVSPVTRLTRPDVVIERRSPSGIGCGARVGACAVAGDVRDPTAIITMVRASRVTRVLLKMITAGRSFMAWCWWHPTNGPFSRRYYTHSRSDQ